MAVGLMTAPVVYGLFVVYWNIVVFRPFYNTRKHLTFADFQKEFEGSSFRREAIEFAYQDLTGVAGYPILRSDHLWSTLHLHPDEVEDATDKRLMEMGIDNICWTVPIDTVEDCVGFWSYVLGAIEDGSVQPAHSEPGVT